jgi:hypothetical protein
MQSGEKQSYDPGYRYGRQDYQERRNPNYTRYADRFDPPPEPYFRRATRTDTPLRGCVGVDAPS